MAKKPEPTEPYIFLGKDVDTQPLPGSTEDLLREGWKIKTKLDTLKAELKGIEEKLIEKHQECSLVIPGLCRCPIATSVRVSFDDTDQNVEGLKNLFGELHRDYVKREVKHSATPALNKIAKDPAHKMYQKVAKFLNINWGAYGIKWNTSK